MAASEKVQLLLIGPFQQAVSTVKSPECDAKMLFCQFANEVGHQSKTKFLFDLPQKNKS